MSHEQSMNQFYSIVSSISDATTRHMLHELAARNISKVSVTHSYNDDLKHIDAISHGSERSFMRLSNEILKSAHVEETQYLSMPITHVITRSALIIGRIGK